jgi:hypothetical protein
MNCKLMASIPALFDPLLSIVIFSGNPLDPSGDCIVAMLRLAGTAVPS